MPFTAVEAPKYCLLFSSCNAKPDIVAAAPDFIVIVLLKVAVWKGLSTVPTLPLFALLGYIVLLLIFKLASLFNVEVAALVTPVSNNSLEVSPVVSISVEVP